jgi:hypothetical protein
VSPRVHAEHGDMHTIAATMMVSSHPKALTNFNRTKHRKHTAMKDRPKKIIVTIKIDALRSGKLSMITGG